MGLLGEVVPNISAELLELLNSVKQRNEAAAGQETGAEPSRCWLEERSDAFYLPQISSLFCFF